MTWSAEGILPILAILHGEFARAEALANEAFELGRAASPQSATIVDFTQVVSICREQDRIGELLPLIEPNPARTSRDALLWNLPPMAQRLSQACGRSVSTRCRERTRATGALATCLGDYEAATIHFERAIAQYDRKGVRVARARACFLYAEMRLRRSAAGDKHKASALLDISAAPADDLGLARVQKLVRRLRSGAPVTELSPSCLPA